MIFQIVLFLLTFTVAILVTGWYRFKYRPKQYIKRLIAEGVSIPAFPDDKEGLDGLYGLKKGIKANPDMKAFVAKRPNGVFLFIIDTELIKEVLTNHQYYSKMNKKSELNSLFNRRSLTLLEGDTWKLHRKVLSEAFQYDLFNDMIPTILEGIDEVIGINSKQKKTILAPKDIGLITSDVVTRVFFGLRSRDVMINGLRASEEATYLVHKTGKYNTSMIRFLLGMWALNFSSEYREVKKRMKTFREVFGKKIRERMEEIKAHSNEISTSKRRDLLEILLQHRIKHNNDPAHTLTDDEILDEFALLFIAGKDTTSMFVSMALYCFATFPECQEKILQEIDEKIKYTNQINLDTLNSMDSLSAFVNEVLRFYPSAPYILPRVANRDHYLGKFFIRKGYALSTLFIANHFNPKYFDNPEKFDPSRWLKEESQARNEGWKHNSFAYVPFSAGPRNCIGKNLALIEGKCILISILKNYEVQLEPGFKLKLGGLGPGYGPKEPIPFVLTPK